MSFKVPSHPNHSMVLSLEGDWFCSLFPLTLTRPGTTTMDQTPCLYRSHFRPGNEERIKSVNTAGKIFSAFPSISLLGSALGSSVRELQLRGAQKGVLVPVQAAGIGKDRLNRDKMSPGDGCGKSGDGRPLAPACPSASARRKWERCSGKRVRRQDGGQGPWVRGTERVCLSTSTHPASLAPSPPFLCHTRNISLPWRHPRHRCPPSSTAIGPAASSTGSISPWAAPMRLSKPGTQGRG